MKDSSKQTRPEPAVKPTRGTTKSNAWQKITERLSREMKRK